MGARLGVLIAVVVARHAAADPFSVEAGGGFTPTFVPGSGALGAGVTASVGGSYDVTRWFGAGLRATTGVATTDVALYHGGSCEGPDACPGATGIFGVIGPAAQLWPSDSVLIGIGVGLAWQYEPSAPFPWEHGLGLDLRVGTTVATYESGRLIAQLGYVGKENIGDGGVHLPLAVSFALSYEWRRATPAPD